MHKHSSLFVFGIGKEQKCFLTLTPGLEPVIFSFHFNVGSLAVDGVGGAEVVEGGQEVEPILSLELFIAGNF